MPKRFMGGAAGYWRCNRHNEEAIMQFQQETRDPSKFLMVTGAALVLAVKVSMQLLEKINQLVV